MHKFLFIHYHYPPMHNSGVYRNYYLSHAIAKFQESDVFVLTTDNVKLFAQDPLPIAKNVTVETIYTFDYRTIISKLLFKKSVGGSQFKESHKQNSFMQFIIKLQRSFPFLLLLGEGSLLYIWNGYRRAIKLIEKKEITTVYTSFMPYADHLIGYLLKRKYPHLIWIADFRDLHLEPIYKNTLWPSLQQRFEKRILSQANIVTSVSDGLCDKLRDYHHNVVTITKGVTVRPEQQLYDQFTISYVGGLFGEYRDPRPVFKAIQSWRKSVNSSIRFLYVGKDGGQMRTWARQCGMEDIFVDGGFIKREDASLVQDCSHINLLLTSSSVEHKGVLTGKLFDYIESRRPILCSVNGVYDEELESLFKQYKLGQIFYPEQEFKVVQYIDYMYTEWKKTGALAGVSNIKLLEETLSWDGQARKLMDRID